MDAQPHQDSPKPSPKALPGFDPLVAYANWFMAQPAIPASIYSGLTRVGSFSGLVLHRQGAYQAQLWLCDPNSHITPHKHPGVDQVHIFISGSADFTINGQPQVVRDALRELPNGRSNANGYAVRVHPGDVEEAKIGPEGWAFITCQHWLNGKPQSVEIDWEGEPLDAAHAIAIRKS